MPTWSECQAEIEQLGLQANVTLITDFLPDEVARALLVAADVIVLPYEQTQESASGALRFVLTAGRPVVVSDNPVFTDAHGAVDVLDDTSPRPWPPTIDALLLDEGALDELARRSRQLVAIDELGPDRPPASSLYLGGRGPRAGSMPPLEEDLAVPGEPPLSAGQGLDVRPTSPAPTVDVGIGVGSSPSGVAWLAGRGRGCSAVDSGRRGTGRCCGGLGAGAGIAG